MITLLRRVAPRAQRLLRGKLSLCALLAATTSSVILPSVHAQLSGVNDASATNPGSIEGTLLVRDSERPATGVMVTIRETGATVTTDERGRYRFENVMPGTYTVVAAGDGWGRTRITDVVVHPDSQILLSRQLITSRTEGEPLELEEYMVSARRDGVVELDPYEVRERRATPFSTANMDLTRTREDVLPFNTFDARDIERSGASNILDFLRARVTQNVSQTLSTQETTIQFGRQTGNFGDAQTMVQGSEIDLRGWGQMETVILVNGVRLPRRYTGDGQGNPTGSTANRAGDISSIPIGSIERIEYLPSAGSAIYGAGATGGVINIITKKNYSGGQVTLLYSDFQKASAPSRSVDFNYMFPLPGGFEFSIAAGWREAKTMRVEDVAEDTILRWRGLMLQRQPERVTQFAGIGGTPNIIAFNLWGDSQFGYTSVPNGYTGSSTPDVSVFQARRNVYNLELSEGGQRYYGSKRAQLGLDTESFSYLATLSKRFNDNWRVSAEFGSNRHLGELAGSRYMAGNVLQVPAAAPTNPFGRQVLVYFDDPRMAVPGTGARFERISERVALNVNGEIGDWRLVAAFHHTKDNEENRMTQFNSPVGGFRAAVMAGTYNPFVDLRVTAPAPSSFYQGANFLLTETGSTSKTTQGTLRASGRVWELPAGEIQLTAGIEREKVDLFHSYETRRMENSVTGQPYTPMTGDLVAFLFGNYVDDPRALYKYTSDSLYGETSLPVFAEHQNIPFVNKLELFASGRITAYERTAYRIGVTPLTPFTERPENSTVYAFGFRYDMHPDVTLRVSRSIGFIPPGIGSVLEEPVVGDYFFPLIDRARNDEVFVLMQNQYRWGGRPGIKPETTESTNFGLVYTPHQVKGLRLSLDYSKNIRNDAIWTFWGQEFLDYESTDPAIAALITRAAPEPGAPNGVGRVTFIDMRAVNVFQTDNRALDLSVDYTRNNVFGGRLALSASATKNIGFKRQTAAGSPAVEYLNNPTLSDGLRWNGTFQANWEGVRWNFGWTARYFDRLLVHPNDVVAQGATTAPWALEHDLMANYRVPPTAKKGRVNWLFSDASISFGVRNVFDREPRFWAAATDRGVVNYDSVMGRNFWIQIRKNL